MSRWDGHTYVRVIERLDRLQSTVNGNARWRVHFTDGTTALTKPDTHIARIIADNAEYQDCPLLVETTTQGEIWNLTPGRYATPDECEDQLSGKREDLLLDWKGDLVVLPSDRTV